MGWNFAFYYLQSLYDFPEIMNDEIFCQGDKRKSSSYLPYVGTFLLCCIGEKDAALLWSFPLTVERPKNKTSTSRCKEVTTRSKCKVRFLPYHRLFLAERNNLL